MTTNTFSHKPCNWTAAFVDSMQRNRPLLIFSILLMLAAPLQACLECGDINTVMDTANGLTLFFQVLEVVVPILLSVVVPFIVFSYIYNRRAIDLYHALPIKRTSLFVGKYLSGLVLVFAPTALGYGLALLVCYLMEDIDSLKTIIPSILPETIMIYTFVVFMVVCCGTIWETILYGAGLSVALVGSCFSVPALVEQLYGYFFGSSALSEWLLAFTPFYFFSYHTETPFYQMVIPVVITIGLFCAALFLYQNRKSESTGAAFAFRFLFHVVSVFISLSLIVTLYVINGGLISALILGFIAYFVMSVIANRGFKKLLPVFARSAAILAVSAAFIVTFQQTGGFGFESRIPALADIEMVYMNPVSVGSGQTLDSYDYVFPTEVYISNPLLKKRSKAADKQSVGYQEEENLRLIRELHQSLIQNRGNEGKSVDLQIVYRLKNGDLIHRKYHWIPESDFDRLAVLNASSEYLKVKYSFMREGHSYGTSASAAIISPLDIGGVPIFYETLDVSADEVAKALKADIAARPLGFEVEPNADFIGRLALSAEKNSTSQLWMDWDETDIVNIYTCDKNILSLLEKRGRLDTLMGSMLRHTMTEPIYIASKERYTGKLPDIYKISGSYRYKEEGLWYKVTNEADRAFLIAHLQPVCYAGEGCNIVGIGDYCYLLSNEYQEEFSKILSRAEIAEEY